MPAEPTPLVRLRVPARPPSAEPGDPLGSSSVVGRVEARDGGRTLDVRPLLGPADSTLLACAGPRPPDQANACVWLESAGDGLRAWCRQAGGSWQRAELLRTLEGSRTEESRNLGILETDALSHASAAVIGLGSGGSTVAELLVKSGLGHIVLADFDRLSFSNVSRHILDTRDVGRLKTAAMGDRLRAIHPQLRTTELPIDILSPSSRPRLRSALAECDVIVAATDTNTSRRVLNRLGVELGIPVIFGKATRRAAGGDVVVSRPGGPCLGCLFPQDGGAPAELSSSSSGDAPAYSDVPVVAEPGLALDVLPIASMCARLALRELLGRRGAAGTLVYDDLAEVHLFLWANRPEGPYAAWTRPPHATRGLRALRWYAAAGTRPDPLCDVCGEGFLESLRAQAGCAPSIAGGAGAG